MAKKHPSRFHRGLTSSQPRGAAAGSCPDLAFFRPEVPRRSAPGFRFPPSPPVPLRPARPSYSRPSSLQSGPPLLGTAREPPWPRPGWRPSGPRRPAQAEGSGLPDSGCDSKGTRNRSGERRPPGTQRWGSQRPTSGPAPRPAVPHSAPLYVLRLQRRAQAPPPGRRICLQAPPHAWVSQSGLARGSSSSLLPVWLRRQRPSLATPTCYLHKIADWSPEKDSSPWAWP